MKKILTATALVATMLAGTVTAAGPTMYGKLHLSVDVMDNGGSSSNGTKYNEAALNSNSSRIGVKGSEDLGDGMSVGYLIEWEVDMTGDGRGMKIRNRAVILSTEDYGSFLAGKWDSPMKRVGRKVDLFSNQIGDTRNMTIVNTTYMGVKVKKATIDGRWDNVIQYASPKASGFQAKVAYSFDTNTDYDKKSNLVQYSGDNQDNDAYSFSVVYDNGPAYVALGYEDTSINKSAMGTTKFDDQKAWRLAGSYYVTDAWKVLASYTDINNTAFVKNLDTEVTTIGTSYKIGNNVLKLQYADRSDFSNVKNSGANMLVVGADHKMSKRTTVYAAYAKVDNDKNSASAPWVQAHDESARSSIGNNADAFSVGIIHKF